MSEAVERPDRLDPDRIGGNLGTERIGRRVIVHDSTASTNDVAAQYGKNLDNDGLVVFAEEQTAGRGRSAAQWVSGYADSLLCSIVLARCEPGADLLSLTSAVAVAEALSHVGPGPVRIKWPNDVLIGEKKVAGILIETSDAGGRRSGVIGIGINCHQKPNAFPQALRRTATSIDIETGRVCDRTSIARQVLISVDHWLATARSDRTQVVEAWKNLSVQLGHRVVLDCDGKRFCGHCIGVDPERGLILQLDRGAVRMFEAAHSSVVKEPSS